ncbi:hypothetical protein BVI1335_1140016 [Burkholderia vietnamiensis]|nr:hypothetical protein BVI1335_1140016 [Burkholderia vietnamiensis]
MGRQPADDRVCGRTRAVQDAGADDGRFGRRPAVSYRGDSRCRVRRVAARAVEPAGAARQRRLSARALDRRRDDRVRADRLFCAAAVHECAAGGRDGCGHRYRELAVREPLRDAARRLEPVLSGRERAGADADLAFAGAGRVSDQ